MLPANLRNRRNESTQMFPQIKLLGMVAVVISAFLGVRDDIAVAIEYPNYTLASAAAESDDNYVHVSFAGLAKMAKSGMSEAEAIKMYRDLAFKEVVSPTKYRQGDGPALDGGRSYLPWNVGEDKPAERYNDIGGLFICYTNTAMDGLMTCEREMCTAFYVGGDLLFTSAACLTRGASAPEKHFLVFVHMFHGAETLDAAAWEKRGRIVKSWWIPEAFYNNYKSDPDGTAMSGNNYAFLRVDKPKEDPTRYYHLLPPGHLLDSQADVYIVGYPSDVEGSLYLTKTAASLHHLDHQKAIETVEPPLTGQYRIRAGSLVMIAKKEQTMIGEYHGAPVFAQPKKEAETLTSTISKIFFGEEKKKPASPFRPVIGIVTYANKAGRLAYCGAPVLRGAAVTPEFRGGLAAIQHFLQLGPEGEKVISVVPPNPKRQVTTQIKWVAGQYTKLRLEAGAFTPSSIKDARDEAWNMIVEPNAKMKTIRGPTGAKKTNDFAWYTDAGDMSKSKRTEDIGILFACEFDQKGDPVCDTCTAFYVGKDLLGGCGHCVGRMRINRDPAEKLLIFIPQFDGRKGVTKADFDKHARIVTNWWVPEKYYNHMPFTSETEASGYDLSFMRVDKPKEKPDQHLSFTDPETFAKEKADVVTIGDPGDTWEYQYAVKAETKLHQATDPEVNKVYPPFEQLDKLSENSFIMVAKKMGTMTNGASGSPVFPATEAGEALQQVVGIHVTSNQPIGSRDAAKMKQGGATSPKLKKDVLEVQELLRQGKAGEEKMAIVAGDPNPAGVGRATIKLFENGNV